MKIIAKKDIAKYAQKENALVIDLVEGAFAPTRYEQELWSWGLGATKYTRKTAKKRISKRWMHIAEKLNLLDALAGKDVYIATYDGSKTIYAQFFEKFVEYLKNHSQG